jgi:hypothetical protein
MNTEQPFGFGAESSAQDYRTIKHLDMGGVVTATGGTHYDTTKDLFNQRRVGICTAISLVQNVHKATGKRYSEDFQYLLQKKFLDGNWDEGSSIFNALKTGVKYGFLPIEDWVYTGELDHDLPYADFIAKLQVIPDTEITRLLMLCEKPLRGYTQVDVSNTQSIAQAIVDSQAGILCRYNTGDTWFRPSWLPKDIDPIKAPSPITGGHAINASYYDMTGANMICEYPNTWGGVATSTWLNPWDMDGICHIIYEQYPMTEAWVPVYSPIPVIVNRPSLPAHQPLTRNLFFGSIGDDVKRLQTVLNVLPASGWFGPKTRAAVIAYQKAHNIFPAWGYVGVLTRAALNLEFFQV